jgi:hypothetical protein
VKAANLTCNIVNLIREEVDIKEMIYIYKGEGESKSFPGYNNTRNRRLK